MDSAVNNALAAQHSIPSVALPGSGPLPAGAQQTIGDAVRISEAFKDSANSIFDETNRLRGIADSLFGAECEIEQPTGPELAEGGIVDAIENNARRLGRAIGDLDKQITRFQRLT